MNMEDGAYKQYCDVLEVSPGASPGEIKRSYLYLKELYSSESIASMALEDEFSESDKREILAQVEKAYRALMATLEKGRRPAESDGNGQIRDEAVARFVAEVKTFNGEVLREIRRKMGIGLDDISMATRIQVRYLSNLEHEDFERLPAEVYTRGFVTGYAEFLALDVDKVVGDFMGRYREWKADHRKGGRWQRFLNRL